MTRWRGLVMVCILLWTSETVLPSPQFGSARQIEERLDLFVCLQDMGERVLEVRRTVLFRGFPGDPSRTVVELRLPWGGLAAPEP